MRNARNSIGVLTTLPHAAIAAASRAPEAKLYKPTHGGYPDTLPSIAPPLGMPESKVYEVRWGGYTDDTASGIRALVGAEDFNGEGGCFLKREDAVAFATWRTKESTRGSNCVYYVNEVQ